MPGSDAAPVSISSPAEALYDGMHPQELQDSVMSGHSRNQAFLSSGRSSDSGDEGRALKLKKKALQKHLGSADHLVSTEANLMRKKELRERQKWKRYLIKLNKEREEVRSFFHSKYYWNCYVEKIPEKVDVNEAGDGKELPAD